MLWYSRRQRVVAVGEEVRRETELQRKARQHLHPHRPVGALEGEHRRLEAGQLRAGRPQAGHARQGDLVGLLVVGGAGRRPHLRLVFPAGVGALAERVLLFGLLRQVEEALGHGEGFVDLRLRDAVIDELEEADLGRRVPELIGDLGLARLEIAHVDARHVAHLGGAHGADGGFLVELGEAVAGLCHRLGHGRLLAWRRAPPGGGAMTRADRRCLLLLLGSLSVGDV